MDAASIEKALPMSPRRQNKFGFLATLGNGGYFIGPEYCHLLEDFSITDVHTTSHNPIGNSIIERVHLTTRNVLRTFTREQEPKTLKEVEVYMDSALATAFHAVQINMS